VKLREKCPNLLFDSEIAFEDTEVKMKSVLYGYVVYVTVFEDRTFHVFKNEVLRKNPTGCNSALKLIIPYLYEAQHVSDNTQPIIKSLKLHWQPLVLHT
jgi:hypothetical protein